MITAWQTMTRSEEIKLKFHPERKLIKVDLVYDRAKDLIVIAEIYVIGF